MSNSKDKTRKNNNVLYMLIVKYVDEKIDGNKFYFSILKYQIYINLLFFKPTIVHLLSIIVQEICNDHHAIFFCYN